MAYSSGGMSKLSYGVTLASALSYFIMKQRDAVGLITFDDQVREYIPPKPDSRTCCGSEDTLAGGVRQGNGYGQTPCRSGGLAP